MAGGARSELASSSPERSTFATAYSNIQRGSHAGPSMERSASIRESIDNRVLSSGFGVARCPALAQSPSPLADVLPLLEPLSFPSHKYTCCGETRKIFGIYEENSSGSVQSKPHPSMVSEFLKHLKASHTEARDRSKQLHESILKLDKFRNLHSRKRQRNENIPNEKPGGSTLLKMGSQSHQNSSDFLTQRIDERTKSTLPNKRIRSSVADVRLEGRGNSQPRQGVAIAIEKEKSTVMDKDKNILRSCNGSLNPTEDKIRGFSAAGDGWDKNMKRRRSVGNMNARTMDGDREIKLAMQQKLANEVCPRSSDGLGFRPGSSNGISGVNKLDGSFQPNASNARNLHKSDLDNVLSSERRERSFVLDKERNIAKGNVKPMNREDSQVGSQSPLTKGKASRGPRSVPNSVMISSNFPRIPGSIDGCEQTQCLNKIQTSGVTNNRKHSSILGPSSPPVTQWGGQKPKSRTRRTNLVSSVSSHDDSQILTEESSSPDIGARLTSNEPAGPSLSRSISNSTHQLKRKPENVPSPAVLSESEESGSAENKNKEKGTDTCEGQDGAMNADQKATKSTVALPIKKSKNSKEDDGDGVRRQGRSARGLGQPKSVLSLKERLEVVNTTKLIRSGRPGLDRNESKVGRPPSKKVSDRKPSTRQVHDVNNDPSLSNGEYDDDHDELLAAATYAYNSTSLPAFFPGGDRNSDSFWERMRPFFVFTGLRNISHLKQQITFAEELDECLDINAHHKDAPKQEEKQANAVGLDRPFGTLHSIDEYQIDAGSGKIEITGWLERFVPLSQRLLAAIILEDDNETLGSDIEINKFSHLASDNSNRISAQVNSEANEANSRMLLEYESELTSLSQKNFSRDDVSCNGYGASFNFRSPMINCYSYANGPVQGIDRVAKSDNELHSEYMKNGLEGLPNMGTNLSGLSPFDCPYEHMSLDDKILVELQSIGLFLETVPDLTEGEDEEIDKDVSELKYRLCQQMRFKRDHLFRLDKAIENVKETEERYIEQLAMNKLVEIAYGKFMGGRGSHGSTHKGGMSKVSKQVALAFAKRTLARCQKFERTGKSCFSEPLYHNIIFSTSGNTAARVNSYEIHGSQPESCAIASSSFANTVVERHGFVSHKLDRTSLDSFQGLGHMPDPSYSKHEISSNRGKKRELLLDDVGSASRSALGSTFPGGAKGKRSERDQNRDASTRGSGKAGRQSSGPSKGERKTKTKLKQKTAQLSASGNGLLGRTTGPHAPLPVVQEPREANYGGVQNGNGLCLPYRTNHTQDGSKEMDENIDLLNLPLHMDSIDDLGVSDELGGQGQDIGSWLNVDEEALLDNDLMGLEIPMDDLSELNMNF